MSYIEDDLYTITILDKFLWYFGFCRVSLLIRFIKRVRELEGELENYKK